MIINDYIKGIGINEVFKKKYITRLHTKILQVYFVIYVDIFNRGKVRLILLLSRIVVDSNKKKKKKLALGSDT